MSTSLSFAHYQFISKKQLLTKPKFWEDFGADPLEAYGGFSKLKYSKEQVFPSELANNGIINWSKIQSNEDGSVGPIDFNNIRWDFNKKSLGWSISQFQLWARGYFTTPEFFSEQKIPILVQCHNIGDFYINNQRFHGDWYNYRTSYNILYLTPNTRYTVDVRVVNEIRIFGDKVPPRIKFDCELRNLELEEVGAMFLHERIIVPDIIGGTRFAGEYMSIPILNTSENEWIDIEKVAIVNFELIPTSYDSLTNGIRLAPSQHQNVKIRLTLEEPYFNPLLPFSLKFDISSKTPKGHQSLLTKTTKEIQIKYKNLDAFYKFTFEDFDESIQYAMIMHPKESITPNKAPILVALHGAGVEADVEFWTNAYPKQRCSWVLLPTGRTPWGYDWHGPSLLNVQYAIKALVNPTGTFKEYLNDFTPDPDKLFISGHSNGGQGAWYYMSHYPDSVIAGTPAAGYVKIQHYVPYFWNSFAHIDSILKGILDSSLAEFNNDLYVSNLVNIPILARAGSNDDNVPPMHSRQMVRLVNEYSNNPLAINLSEVIDQGHWFDNIMSDKVMQDFMNKYLLTQKDSFQLSSDNRLIKDPVLLRQFTITLMNPANFGGKGNIIVEQLFIPFRLGKIHVKLYQVSPEDGLSSITYTLKTTNIRRFKFKNLNENISTIIIDDTEFNALSMNQELRQSGWFYKNDNGNAWKHPLTYGPAHLILESKSPLLIVIGTTSASNAVTSKFMNVAQEISHSWFLYGNGNAIIVHDTDLIDDNEFAGNEYVKGNMVLLGNIFENKFYKDGSFQLNYKKFSDPGTGILFLHPYKFSQLSLIISGTDLSGLDQIAKLFPKRTGVPIPDWIITGSETKWKGVGGLLGAGFWDNEWRYNDAIGYLV
ncbi:2966_t:CDS:10 [Funneliformis caledonium]|uniref:2966_t:CDS:1 n=1 Tax=Funneliformis caledonium TaxID=1117310 RepID=A0A9N9A3T6_9GLOM|nr:2966_t:CDS:10 [Funneliformis caledonium]